MLSEFSHMKKCLKPDGMRTRVGLKPEEYTEKDTNIMNLE